MNTESPKMKHRISFDEETDETYFSPILVGVSGGSASGKTTLCYHISKSLSGCVIFSLDNYYKGLTDPSLAKNHNFDDPSSLDFDLMFTHIQQLMNRKPCKVPNYCFITHKRLETTTTIFPSDIIFFEGIFALYDPRIRDMMTFKIFVHCDDDVRLSRRILRDVTERGRDPAGILEQYNRFVKPSYTVTIQFQEFIKPAIDYADLIVPGGRSNFVSIQFIVQNLKNILKGIDKIKDYIKDTLFFHGDKMENFWLVPQSQSSSIETPSMINVYVQKQLIFETDEFTKKQIRQFMNQFLEEFNHKFMRKSMRFCFKLTLQLFLKSIRQQNIEFTDVDYDGSGGKKCCMILIPWVTQKTVKRYVDLVKKIRQQYKENQIYILNIFSTISQLVQFVNIGSNIHLINILCISNEQNFMKTIKKNCQEYTNEIEQSFLHDYRKVIDKFCSKQGCQDLIGQINIH